MYYKIIIILSILLSYPFAQRSPRDFERELKAQNSAIQSLKDEIEATKKINHPIVKNKVDQNKK